MNKEASYKAIEESVTRFDEKMPLIKTAATTNTKQVKILLDEAAI